MIYYVQPIVGGPIKIGFTDKRRIRSRVSEIQSCSPWPLVTLLAHGGGRSDEQYLHQYFKHLNVHGEWFEPADDLVYWILKLGGSRPLGSVSIPKWNQLKKVQRADGRNWTKVPIYIAESQAGWLEEHCKERHRDLSSVIHEALREYVAKVG